MQDLIKRYFWVIGAATVVTCAMFAAKATASYVGTTKPFADPATAPKITPIATTPTPTTPVKPTRSKDGSALSTRNMFCSECTPAVTVVSTDPSSIQNTTLPLVLLATNVGATPAVSYATVVNTENQKQGAYSIGDQIPGATGKLKLIQYKYIEFENGGHTERLVLAGQTVNVTTPTPPVATNDNPDDITALAEQGVKKIDDTHYEIDKSLIDKVIANPMLVGKQARVVPSMKDGKPNGFKLYAIRPDSVFAKLGLSNGDTLESINNFELSSFEKALEAYNKLRDASSFQLGVNRRNKDTILNYTVR